MSSGVMAGMGILKIPLFINNEYDFKNDLKRWEAEGNNDSIRNLENIIDTIVKLAIMFSGY